MTPARGALALAVVVATALAGAPAALADVDLSSYTRVGRYDLPTPTASEASAVTYDADTDTLFVVGDEGGAVAQVSKTGQLINSMTLSGFDDTEGITYAGNGAFVLVEERVRQLNRFTYVPGGTLTRAGAQTVKLGTTLGNIGLEGATRDPQTGGYIAVKETQPEGIFQTGVDFAAGTATNGSPATENSVNLFDPPLAGLSDFSDVFALANLPAAVAGADAGNLLIISQEAGRVVEVSRAGAVASSLTIAGDPDNPVPVADQGNEGVTMDAGGRLYIVNEGGGAGGRPQLWVYAPGSAPAPSVTLTNQVTTLPDTTSTATRVKVASIALTGDDASTLAVTGPDAASFEVDASGLYVKAGTVLQRRPYTVTVTSARAASAPFTLTITGAATPTGLIISEVSPWSSGNSPYGADWFEVTNTGTTTVSLSGWKVDDSSNAFSSALALNGVPSIAPGQSVIFLEGTAATADAFKAFWNTTVPVGTYSGGGIGLSTDGDAVNLFDAGGNRVTGVTFGASTNFFTFDNPTGAAAVSALSVAGRNGAYTIGGATGSPGRIVNPHVDSSLNIIAAVPPQLSLALGAPAAFGPFVAGRAKDYLASISATVVSTGGDAALSVVDAGASPGRLVNGTYALAQPLQVSANSGSFVTVGGTPATLLSYPGPVSNDVVNLTLKQPIGATDPLRSGTYAKTLTFTLSTTSP